MHSFKAHFTLDKFRFLFCIREREKKIIAWSGEQPVKLSICSETNTFVSAVAGQRDKVTFVTSQIPKKFARTTRKVERAHGGLTFLISLDVSDRTKTHIVVIKRY